MPIKPHADTPARRVFQKFGGVYQTSQALQRLADLRDDPDLSRCVTALYRWEYRGGLIPGSAQQALMDAARLEGIILTPDDFYPGKTMEK